jgi:hypothetical protein
VRADQQAWQYSGVDLPRGYLATLRATGQWTAVPGYGPVGPGGHPELSKALEFYVLPGANRGCLLVRSGDILLAFSRDEEAVEIITPGKIYFCCNDERTPQGAQKTQPGKEDIAIPKASFRFGEGFADNNGTIKVTLTVEKAR